MVYHAYRWNQQSASEPRVMLMDKIEWSSDGWPSVGQGWPSTTPQDAPQINGYQNPREASSRRGYS